MNEFMLYTKKQLKEVLIRINKMIYEEVGKLDITAWLSSEPLPYQQRCKGEERQLHPGDKWGNLFDCAWFRFCGKIPPQAAGKHVVLIIDVHGELCIFDKKGVPLRGLTTITSVYDFSLGSPGKRVFQLSPEAVADEPIEIWADGGCNDLFGNLQGNGTIKQAVIAICNDEIHQLYYDFEVLMDLLDILPSNSARYQKILLALNDSYKIFDDTVEKAPRARERLAAVLALKGGDPSLQVSAIGHAHIDLAWLWPIRETIRKGARTFSTAIDLMQYYPDYIFGASQAQYFLWMKEQYPKLYAKIKQKVKDGQIEVQGAMWVEADTNISGGEALVRQILHGKRFFKQEFGLEINNLWLPDVFGYSAALPQLLKKSGVQYFMTQKISWNLINQFPHQSFHWHGLDGTSILTHMLPEETYNSAALPRSVAKAEQNYHEKAVSDYCLLVYGIGDGGGGPGEEHLERLKRMKNLSGLCPVQSERACDFFEKWEKAAEKFPHWVGELYLERHQGTFTSNARNKRYNRKMELALHDWEWLATLTNILTKTTYPVQRLENIWREVLLYQFHDILPGSSIKRVYDESIARYKAMLEEVNQSIENTVEALGALIQTDHMQEPVILINTLNWPRVDWFLLGNDWHRIKIPAMGYKVIDIEALQQPVYPAISATRTTLENEILRIEFDPEGAIISVYDKKINREVLDTKIPANRLAIYSDSGDAWDFPMDYADTTPNLMKRVIVQSRIDGPKAIMTQVYQFGFSEIRQEVILTSGSRRIDFLTWLRWRETATMLRTSFAVAIQTDHATFDIQFGEVQRPTHQNTSWDVAKDEVPAHKWVDLSQRDYGVALLNDCKYGHKVKGNVIDLNLLRSVPYTGPRLVNDEDVPPGEAHHGYSDQTEHVFTYSLYPHPGDHIAGEVVQAGYELNLPVRIFQISPVAGKLPLENSFIQISASNVILEAVKKAEDGEDIILRLYQAVHANAQAMITINFPVRTVYLTNLMEEISEKVSLNPDCSFMLDFKPFEIKTVRLVLK